MTVVVTGGRNLADGWLVHDALDLLDPRPTVIAQGECPTGADLFAREWAERHGVELLRFPADWRRYGRRAGPLRNREMLEAVRPDLVLAFPGGKGTANCVDRARLLGLTVRKVRS